MQDDIGLGQRLQPQRGDQAGIAGTRAHQPDPALFQRGQAQFCGDIGVHVQSYIMLAQRGKMARIGH